MNSALLDDEQLPDSRVEGVINPGCETGEEEEEGRREGPVRSLPRAGSEGDLLSPRHGETAPLPRRPSLSGLRSGAHRPSGLTPGPAVSRAGQEVTAGQHSDLNCGSAQVSGETGGRIYSRTDAQANTSTFAKQQLNVAALLHTYPFTNMGFGGEKTHEEKGGKGENQPMGTDVSAISLHTFGRQQQQETGERRPSKSILDGCGQCGKLKTLVSVNNETSNEAESQICTCSKDETMVTMCEEENISTKRESSVANKVQKVLDRMQSAFSTTSSSAVSRVSSVDEKACRICWVGDDKEEVITPCDCSGSSAFVHPSCLRKWLQVTTQYRCEICRHEYTTKKKMKPLSEWKFRGAKTAYMSQVEATLILLGIVTPPLICGIILCSQKIMEYINSPEDAWKTAALMTLVLASSCTYIAAIVYLCRKFSSLCKVWIKRNQTTIVKIGDVETVIEPEEEEGGDGEEDDVVSRDRVSSVGSRADSINQLPGEAPHPAAYPISDAVMVWGLT